METQGKYREIPYESESELWFLYWAFELQNKDIVKEIVRPSDNYIITDEVINLYDEIDKKGRVKEKRQVLLKGSSYTADYFLVWDKNKANPFVWLGGEGRCTKPLIGMRAHGIVTEDQCVTVIECKPDFDQNNMTRLFKNNQKIVYHKYAVFVNLVKIKEFFEKTFCPAMFLKTKTGKDRLLHFTPRTLNQYLHDYENS